MKINGKLKGKVNRFNGWDFMELAGEWGLLDEYSSKPWVETWRKIKGPVAVHHKDDSRPIRDFLELLCEEYSKSHDENIFTPYADDIRMYARKLSVQDNSYYAPLWRGLARVEDDFTIVRATILLLPCMWT